MDITDGESRYSTISLKMQQRLNRRQIEKVLSLKMAVCPTLQFKLKWEWQTKPLSYALQIQRGFFFNKIGI